MVGKTPRELLASTTSEDIVEMMAFERLEPFGALHTELAIGQVCAVMANVHRGRDTKPFAPADFFPALARASRGYKAEATGPILLDDPEKQTKLLMALFKRHSPSAEVTT